MPNFDGGHYFLTVLAPIRDDTFVDGEGRNRSRPDMLREILGCLPTAEQSEALPETNAESPFIESPFMRNKKTHLARFVVINDVVYNGRVPSDVILSKLADLILSKLPDVIRSKLPHAIRSKLGGGNLIVARPVDRLNRAYLLFAAEIDAKSGDESELDGYLSELWNTMGTELRAIFEHCEKFTDHVRSAPDFCIYIKKCQLETTMPFNDYWADGLKAKNPPLVRIALAVLAALAACALWLGLSYGHWSWLGWTLAGVVIVALTLVFAYAFVMIKGGRPFPTAKHSDLKSILKALYLQQNFVNFVVQNQGVADDDLHANFAAFIDKHRPQDLDAPTQEPGVIRSKI